MLRYSSPLVQVIIVGFICLLTSGMFNALTGLGGGGQVDVTIAANANVALYTCFAVGGLFAGAVVNKMGPSFSLVLGGLTYTIYTGSLLYYNHRQRADFPIIAGAILGLGAALLWTGQGAIMLSYPTEDNKGKYIGLFWVIFNVGGVLGSVIPIALNWNSENTGTVNDGTYIAFMVLMAFGGLLAIALLPPRKVRHDDGKSVVVQKFPKWKDEIIGIAKLFFDWRMLALFPMFIASNWFYPYQFNSVNAGYFNIRTRTFNNLWYWAAQIVGAMTFGKFLDTPSLGRRKRGIIGLFILFIVLMATWIGGLIFQLSFSIKDGKRNFDLFESGYAGKIILYIVYGLNDAMYQCYAYWIMGALTNDSSLLARYTGYYKAIQSAGAAIAWRVNAIYTPYLIELIICWVLLVISIPFALIVVLSIKETNYDEEKVEKTDVEKPEKTEE